MELKPNLKKRICFLDELRGFAVLCMVFYHAFYLLGTFFNWYWANGLFDFFMPVQPIFAGIFIFICGLSCTLSKSNLKRGAVLLAVALGFTFVTSVIMPAMGFVECEIYFGILHFLAVSILIYSLLSKAIHKTLPFAGILFCAVLYAFTSGIGEGTLRYGELITFTLPESLYESNTLMILGIHSHDFFSADYFPIFPDIFIFFAGVFSGVIFLKKGYPDWCGKKRIPFFGFLGRNALLIYVVHMPVIYALGYLIIFIVN